MSDPFEQAESEARKAVARHLATAEAIDQDEEISVTPWEMDFLDSILKQLRAGRALSQKQIDVLNRMSDKYGVG